jgi:hypothetical protein
MSSEGSSDIEEENAMGPQTETTRQTRTLPRTLAAPLATEAEQRIAKSGEQPDGSKLVSVPKRVWRPKVKFQYEEPEDLLDTSEDLDWMIEEK